MQFQSKLLNNARSKEQHRLKQMTKENPWTHFSASLRDLYNPESIFNPILGANQVCQTAQFSSVFVKSIFFSISPALSKNCTPKPSATCQAIWQCINQAPGLFVINAITTHPLPGSIVTSRLVGFLKFRSSMLSLLKILEELEFEEVSLSEAPRR